MSKESEGVNRSEILQNAIVNNFRPMLAHEFGHYVVARTILPTGGEYRLRVKFKAFEKITPKGVEVHIQHDDVKLGVSNLSEEEVEIISTQEKIIAAAGIATERLMGYNFPHLTQDELISESDDYCMFSNLEEFEEYVEKAGKIIKPQVDKIKKTSGIFALGLAAMESGDHQLREKYFQNYFHFNNPNSL